MNKEHEDGRMTGDLDTVLAYARAREQAKHPPGRACVQCGGRMRAHLQHLHELQNPARVLVGDRRATYEGSDGAGSWIVYDSTADRRKERSRASATTEVEPLDG